MTAAGELDSLTAEMLGAELDRALDERPSALVLDLSGLTFVDSRGVRTVTARRDGSAAVETGIHVSLPPGQVREVFALTGDDVALHDDLTAALSAASAPAEPSGPVGAPVG